MTKPKSENEKRTYCSVGDDVFTRHTTVEPPTDLKEPSEKQEARSKKRSLRPELRSVTPEQAHELLTPQARKRMDGVEEREPHNRRKDLDPMPLHPTEKSLFPRVSKPRRTSKNRTNRSAVMVKPRNGEHISREIDREA
ncbi:unnamed protein product [Brassica rapa subsp. trilocularis]